MDAKDLTVGQQVWLYSSYGRGTQEPRRGTITKIGRKIVTIENDDKYKRTTQYRIAEQSVNETGGHTPSAWFKTDEQRIEAEERALLMLDLKETPVELRGFRSDRVTNDQLRAIIAIFKESDV